MEGESKIGVVVGGGRGGWAEWWGVREAELL